MIKYRRSAKEYAPSQPQPRLYAPEHSCKKCEGTGSRAFAADSGRLCIKRQPSSRAAPGRCARIAPKKGRLSPKRKTRWIFMQDPSQPLSSKEALAAMRPIIENGGDFLLHVTGGSMSPTLCGGRDSVLISPLRRTPRRGDILLICTESQSLLLHRVTKCEKNGAFYVCGDAYERGEGPFSASDIVGIASKLYRKGRCLRADSPLLRLYGSLWILLLSQRHRLLRLLSRRKRF